jgi:predicted phage-related endonuclease
VETINNAPGTGAQISHKMAMRFAKSDTKFTGDLDQSYTEFISNYQDASKYYELTPTQKLQYIYLLFDGEAKRFYRNYVANTVKTFNEAHARLLEEHNSSTRQNRVKKELSRLRVLEIAQKEKIYIHAAVERARN